MRLALLKVRKALSPWTKQGVGEPKSGKPSTQGGKATVKDTYLLKLLNLLVILSMLLQQRAKRRGTAKGKQFVAQPKKSCKKESKTLQR